MTIDWTARVRSGALLALTALLPWGPARADIGLFQAPFNNLDNGIPKIDVARLTQGNDSGPGGRRPVSCGLGAELALLGVLLRRWRRVAQRPCA